MKNQKVYFYAPRKNTHHFFEYDTLNWSDISEMRRGNSGNFTSWIVTTYILMRQSGLDCEVVSTIPDHGILLADRDTLGNTYPYLNNTMLICAKGDREFHPSAHIHVVHNPLESRPKFQKNWNSCFIPHWPQPSLIPRKEERKADVKTIAFIGSRSNISKELLSEKWINELSSMGCEWNPVFGSGLWNDYSAVDAVIAVRDFNLPPSQPGFSYKPASKLINCWLASVPALLFPESAFMSVRKSELDFLIVNSLDDAIHAVKRLKDNPKLYEAMVKNGQERAKEFTQESIKEKWLNFFQNYVGQEYLKFKSMPSISRRLAYLKRYGQLKLSRTGNRLQNYRISIGMGASQSVR